MPRRLPRVDADFVPNIRALPGVVSSKINYEIITPLIGGGTESYKNDEHTIVRVSSIRGILRFWWRATRGGLSRGDARHLRRLESRIWGGNCREYTANAERCTVPVETNCISEHGVFTCNGYTIRWHQGEGFDVHNAEQRVFYDVKIRQDKQSPSANRSIVDAHDVVVVRADIDNNHRVQLVVATGGLYYQISVTDAEIMYPSRVQMYVDSVIVPPPIINETSPSGTLLPGAGNTPINDERSDLSYVLFPLRNVTGATIRAAGVQFTLQIAYPEIVQQDINAALWAWEHFGGLGARTRRGLGAVERRDDARQPIQYHSTLLDRLNEGLRLHVVQGVWPANTPHLNGVQVGQYSKDTGNIKIVNHVVQNDARAIWRQLFEKYRDFRQHRLLNDRGQPFKANVWPEPNSLRQMANPRANAIRPVPPFNVLGFQNHFPRGQMGLPIEFFFTPGKFDPAIRADVKYTMNIQDLHSDKEGRFASPVLFRPVRDMNGYRGVLLILGGTRAPVTARVTRSGRASNVQIYGNPGASLQARDGTPHGPTTTDDVLHGLFNFFECN